MIYPNPLLAQQKFFAPEVVQTSAMDCGPASLKCLLEGFGIPASYGRLREACQTDVDGTSIDTLEDVAVQLGLQAQQVMVPIDHLFMAEGKSLPALVVTLLPAGLPHFVVVWGTVGNFVQLMDPGTGRRWLSQKRFINDVYRHTMPFPAKVWRMWAGTDEFSSPLRQRLLRLHLSGPAVSQLIYEAVEDTSWHSFATLDATARMTESIVKSGGLRRGPEAAALVQRFFKKAREEQPNSESLIPPPFWLAQPRTGSGTSTPPEEEELLMQGAVLIRIRGKYPKMPASQPQRNEPSATIQPESAEAQEESAVNQSTQPPQSVNHDTAPTLSSDLVAALEEEPSRPEFEILRLLRKDGLLTPSMVLVGLLMAALGLTIEVALFRGLLELTERVDLIKQQEELLFIGICFALAMLLLEIPIAMILWRMGRRLETRLRVAFLEKIPRLGDRYFRSRLTSDMIQRSYDLRILHTLPNLGARFLKSGFQMFFVSIGIIILHRGSLLITILAASFVMALIFFTQPLLIERNLRVRTHASALSRFYLDSLLGLIPARMHSAERAIRREHEGLLVKWALASFEFYRVDILIQAFIMLTSLGFAAWIVFSYIAGGGEASGVLLLLYWALNLPAIAQSIANIAKQYPTQRNSVLRLLEPLGAPNEDDVEINTEIKTEGVTDIECATQSAAQKTPSLFEGLNEGISIQMNQITVQAGGHMILQGVDLTIQPGEHIAIVGTSGAGKSTLVGLLLGWHKAAKGVVQVDDIYLQGEAIHALRKVTAWVDPAVQLWNRSMLENLQYGIADTEPLPAGEALTKADLYGVLEKLPNGLQTPLGEGGKLVSGGEGQRVRFARALSRPGVRLAILDEPFRGLDRSQRHQLLQNARQHWQNATLICITHDVGETQGFPRVLVVEDGQIVEDAPPNVLAARPDSRYQALLAAEEAVNRDVWEQAEWRQLWMEDGELIEI